MQDEINEKVVALSIRGAKTGFHITDSVLKAAMRKYLRAHDNKSRQTPRGKQTVAKLMNQNQGLTNIEVTDGNIKSFERVANKYKIDYALKKDKSMDPPRYLVFFKARDVDVMTAAFKEFSSKEMTKSNKPSIVSRLIKYQQKAQDKNRQREKVNKRERGQEL